MFGDLLLLPFRPLPVELVLEGLAGVRASTRKPTQRLR